MKKISIYCILFILAFSNIFASCDEEAQKKAEKRDKNKRFFTKYVIYDNVDSLSSNISVFVGEIEGHKYKYHLFNGKNKSQMVIEHDTLTCKACKKNK